MQNQTNNNYDLIVIGAGASGLIASGYVGKYGKKVLLIDKNQKVGRKIIISGKGRCNVTNDCGKDTFINSVRRNPKFLLSSFNNFTSQDTIHFFEDLGVKLKVERGNRVFPLSDKSTDIVDALYRFIKNKDIQFIQDCANEVTIDDNSLFKVVTLNGNKYFSRNVLVSTGGVSYPGTGSTGDGYKIAKNFGHKIINTEPSLIPIELNNDFCNDLMGLSLKNVSLNLCKNNKIIYTEIGEMLFTHFGVSGPLVLTASTYIEKPFSQYKLYIDFKPGLTKEKLNSRILRDLDTFKNNQINTILEKLLPKKIIPYILQRSLINPVTKSNSITKIQRLNLINSIKFFELNIKKFRPINEAIVTRGGIDTSEINPKTMESKLVKGLYFAGEIIDVDAITGGFNLQIAFSTGYTVAKNFIE